MDFNKVLEYVLGGFFGMYRFSPPPSCLDFVSNNRVPRSSSLFLSFLSLSLSLFLVFPIPNAVVGWEGGRAG